MDAGQLASSMNVQVVKEPRGFIRFIQVVLAIFAFATTCSVSSFVMFTVKCASDNSTNPYKVSFSYPFKLEDVETKVTGCNGSQQTVAFVQGAGAPSQFYVFIGVMAFLYSLATIVLYIFFDDLYRKKNFITIADFITTGVFVVFWLISSSAWAQGVSNVKYFTEPKNGLIPHITACKDSANTCTSDKSGSFGSLNVSIIFGFLNMAVWAGNMWFLYKETPWFKGDKNATYNPDSTVAPGSGGGSPTSPTAP